MQILAAIPCYNEEVTIGSVVLKAFRHVDAVLVIDDGSRDCTGQVAEDAGAIVIKHASNRGKAAGVIAAVRYAKEHGFDILVLLDGDGQHKAEEIPTIVQPLLSGEADAVIGSRFLQNNGTIPLYRRLGQKVLTLVTNARSSKKLTDSQSGFRGLNVKALNSLPLESDGYSIESDMITFLSKNGIAMQEVPISAVYDVPNKHKKNPFYHGYDILARMVGEIGYQRPMLLFGITGIVLLFSGIAFGFHAFAYYHSTHTLPFGPALASSIGLILGMLLIVAGLILNSLVLIMNKE
ncbi:MAG: glycosyltransferase family 2 protein [Methanomicrobiales archaeon]|nr:glycosyltransferase family 2 protein [Methanomicrobiales archaeon]MDI6877638.1 glycosyltransferase family 2 protein [Methanomicrobiales archaeon]